MRPIRPMRTSAIDCPKWEKRLSGPETGPRRRKDPAKTPTMRPRAQAGRRQTHPAKGAVKVKSLIPELKGDVYIFRGSSEDEAQDPTLPGSMGSAVPGIAKSAAPPTKGTPSSSLAYFFSKDQR